MTDAEIERYLEIARRDDWHTLLNGSELRMIIGELQRCRMKVAGFNMLIEQLRDLVKD